MITIDGKLVHNFPYFNPKSYNDATFSTGDDVDPPSDASYKNLVWENLPVPDILFQREIPTIVSLEYKIKGWSLVKVHRTGLVRSLLQMVT